ncbi:MAG: drug/metabolite transporter (DMT)-like permease [Paracoccaceae bacterium]|jgi:drug/metabolite transporter (DMT)-like permease
MAGNISPNPSALRQNFKDNMSKNHATLIGFSAVILWSLLALFTVSSAPVPALQLNTICFGIGGCLGCFWLAFGSGFGILKSVSWKVYLSGTLGLFGYHVLYFSALRLAPAAEAGLIAYLWPLLIVLFSGLLPGERLLFLHILGGLIAFGGAALLVLGQSVSVSPTQSLGYGLAFLCAITWSTYSVLSRKFGAVPTEAVTVFCLAAAFLSLISHLVLETTLWPESTSGWLAILALGLGPVGLAFFTWDIGMKKGDIQLLGVGSYAAPLFSTLTLVALGFSPASSRLALAAILITLGAIIAAFASARTSKARPNVG